MRAVIQRVSHARVTIEGKIHGEIGKGLLILLGVCEDDTEAEAVYLADKCVGLRIFTDENDKMNLSPADIGGGLLVISQFTLYGDCKKGRRPSFVNAGPPQLAEALYEQFLTECRAQGFAPQHGEFGAHMEVASVNDGPVTLILDTDDWK